MRPRIVIPQVLVRGHIAQVARECKLCPDAISSASRTRTLAAARWEVWRRLNVNDGFGCTAIARAWGCDHTSVINGLRQVGAQ